MTFQGAGEFLREGTEADCCFGRWEAGYHQKVECRRYHNFQVISAWVSTRVLRVVVQGTKAEMGGDDMAATCRAVHLPMWMGIASISTVT